MKRIGDRSFLLGWQTIRAATQPGPEASAWRVGDVAWHRHRLSHSCPDFAVVADTHRLDQSARNGSWSLLVVVETWWDSSRHVIRSQVWATPLSGSGQHIQNWVKQQAEIADRKNACANRTAGEGARKNHDIT